MQLPISPGYSLPPQPALQGLNTFPLLWHGRGVRRGIPPLESLEQNKNILSQFGDLKTYTFFDARFCEYLVPFWSPYTIYTVPAQESNLWGKFCRLMVRCDRQVASVAFCSSGMCISTHNMHTSDSNISHMIHKSTNP